MMGSRRDPGSVSLSLPRKDRFICEQGSGPSQGPKAWTCQPPEREALLFKPLGYGTFQVSPGPLTPLATRSWTWEPP